MKKNSALWQRQEELKKAEQNFDINLSKLEEYEHSSEELVQITKKIGQLQNVDLPKLFEQKQQISQKADARIQLERDITFNKKELEPLKIRYQIINKAFLEINKLYAEIQTKEEAQKTFLKNQLEKKAQEIILNKKLQKIQEGHSNLKKYKQ